MWWLRTRNKVTPLILFGLSSWNLSGRKIGWKSNALSTRTDLSVQTRAVLSEWKVTHSKHDGKTSLLSEFAASETFLNLRPESLPSGCEYSQSHAGPVINLHPRNYSNQCWHSCLQFQLLSRSFLDIAHLGVGVWIQHWARWHSFPRGASKHIFSWIDLCCPCWHGNSVVSIPTFVPSCFRIEWEMLQTSHVGAFCGDITNTLVGISGETVPEGGNLHIYCVHLVSDGSKFAASVSHHTPPPPGALASTANFNYSEYFLQ